MKTRRLLSLLFAMVVLLGCSFFSKLGSSPSGSREGPEKAPQSDFSTEGWQLPDPSSGLAGLESYHQQLTVNYRGTRNGSAYEWNNTYQRDVWTKSSADFLRMTSKETGLASEERLFGVVGQAQYQHSGAGETCQVNWGAAISEEENLLDPASLLPAIEQAKDAGAETVNGVPANHYVIEAEQLAGEYWLAEPGGYLVRYVLTISGEEGEQHFEYELLQVNARQEVVYPEGCVPVLLDFPVMEGARSLYRLPESVSYTVPAEMAAASQFYQDQLAAQGWTLANVHDKDPENLVLLFANPEKGKSASIVLRARPEGVWVSAIVRPWEAMGQEFFEPEE